MYINYSTFVKLYNEALEEDDLEMYIAERGWQDWMGNEDKTDEIILLLQTIHEAVRSNFISLRKMLKVSQIEMIRIYDISRRTLQTWESEERKPSDHVKKLLSYAVIMETLNKENNDDTEK